MEEYGLLLTTRISTCDGTLEWELSAQLKARSCWRA